MWFNQKSSYFLDTFGKQCRYLNKLRSGNSGNQTLVRLFSYYIRAICLVNKRWFFKTFSCFSKYLTLLRVEAIFKKKKKMSLTAGTSSSRDPFSEVIYNINRAFVVKCGPIQPSLNFCGERGQTTSNF